MMATKQEGKCSQDECLKQAKGEGVKMHKLDYAGRSNGWTDRLKRSAGAKFKRKCFVFCSGDRRGNVFMCCLVRLVLRMSGS